MIACRCPVALVAALCFGCSSSGSEGSPQPNSGGMSNLLDPGQGAGAGMTGAPAGAGGNGGDGGSAGSAAGAAGSADVAGAGGSMGGSSAGGTGTAGSAVGGGGTAGAPSGGASGGGSGGAAGGGGGSGGMMALEPCAEPSVSRLKVWEMQVVGGTQVPASGSPLREVAGGGHELYVEWTLEGGGYGTANAPLENQGEYSNGATPGDHPVDISTGPGITVEYASTGNTYMQIRTATVPHGGDHFRADLPSTDGMIETITIALDSFRRPGGDTPPGNDVLQDAFSFTFVGGGTTELTLRQVLIPGFVPPCD